MSHNNKIVVFDFDGVVCDSTDECMVTSWNAWEKWNKRDNFRTDLTEFSKQDKSEFLQVRPRVRGAGEYYILRRAFSEGLVIRKQVEYDQLEEEWKDNIDPFKKVFFEQREKLRKIDLNSWIDLHPVFDDVIQVMKILDNENRLYIATLKDSTSVRLILNKQGLKITNNKLLDQSQIETKLQALDIFRNKVGCDKSDMIFVDDNVTHLSRPKSAGYPVYLAVWGNTIDEYLKIAQTSAIDTLGDCYELL